MVSSCANSRVSLKNIVYLTDFSRSSEAALPFARTLASAHNAKMYALHVLVPDVLSYMTPESPLNALEWRERAAVTEMNKIDAGLSDVSHEALIERADSLWAALDPKLKQYGIDLVVLGTHGRTGFRKLVMGSTAEKILRKSSVPVMTVGPAAYDGARADGQFRRLLLATDLKEDSEAAAAYALSLAQENQAELIVAHVIHGAGRIRVPRHEILSIAEAMHRLQQTVPLEAQAWCRPEFTVEYGKPGARIVALARRKSADLIVLGVRNVEHLFAATHLEIRTAHEVIAHAGCPVLCVPTGFVPAS